MSEYLCVCVRERGELLHQDQIQYQFSHFTSSNFTRLRKKENTHTHQSWPRVNQFICCINFDVEIFISLHQIYIWMKSFFSSKGVILREITQISEFMVKTTYLYLAYFCIFSLRIDSFLTI